MFEDALAHAKTTPLHRHPEADETVYVLDGEIVVNVDGQESRVGVGGMMFTPKGVPHAFLVVSERRGYSPCRLQVSAKRSTATRATQRSATRLMHSTSHASKRRLNRTLEESNSSDRPRSKTSKPSSDLAFELDRHDGHPSDPGGRSVSPLDKPSPIVGGPARNGPSRTSHNPWRQSPDGASYGRNCSTSAPHPRPMPSLAHSAGGAYMSTLDIVRRLPP